MIPLISFCSQCKGRKHHLEETLPHNLTLLEKYPRTDFSLLDFDSNDGLEEWIYENFQPYLDSGKLKYHKVHNQPYYFQSAVKNLSHHLSIGDNIVNVDADNFLTETYVMRVISIFSHFKNAVVYMDTPEPELYDLFGRIGMSRKLFNLIKGYDEIYEKWGDEDHDILRRLFNVGKTMDVHFEEIKPDPNTRVISHGPGSRNLNRKITHSYLPPKQITSRYYGKFIK